MTLEPQEQGDMTLVKKGNIPVFKGTLPKDDVELGAGDASGA